ncbi:MAG: Hsp20 family protein [Alphaproteobacteria bacterium]
MGHFDLTPLYRSTVGFDHLTRLLDSAFLAQKGEPSYPPYNIAKIGEDHYQIILAVAGFDEADIDITVQENKLEIAAESRQEDEEVQYLHRGIAGRSFRHVFQLADTVKVLGARLNNGLLHINLEREIPEEARPRKIEITTAKGAKIVDHKAA